jgi:hypothetical protein
LGAGLGGARLLELELVRLGLDDEQRRPLLHLVAVFVIDLLQKALHPRDQIGGVYGRGITGGLEVAGDFLLHRNGDGDLRRRRRHIPVLLSTARERRREGGCRGASGELRARPPINPHRATLNSHGRGHRLIVRVTAGFIPAPLSCAARLLGARNYDPVSQRGSLGVSKHSRRPKAPAVPFPRVSCGQELVLSTVTARRFCDQHEISLHTATGRSLP